jgi:radical SAM superfamily enzyme
MGKEWGTFHFWNSRRELQEMMDSVTVISELPLHSIKLHQLQIVRRNGLGRRIREIARKVDLFTLDEYVQFLSESSAAQPGIIIERLAAETKPWNNLSEIWGGLRYDQVLRRIEERMRKSMSGWGKLYPSSRLQIIIYRI